MQIVVPSQPALVTILQQIEADSHIPAGPLSADVPIYSEQSHGAVRHRDVLHERPPSGTDGASTSAVFDGNGNGIGNNGYDNQHAHAHTYLRNTNGRTRARDYREQDEPMPADEEMPNVRLSSILFPLCSIADDSFNPVIPMKEDPSPAEREVGHSAPDSNGR